MIDPYVYDGTEILKNKFNIKNAEKLREIERGLTSQKALKFLKLDLPKKFDFNYLKKIHKFVFGDLYSWAGKPRTIDIYKENAFFCKSVNINLYAEEIFGKLERKNYLKDIKTKEEFALELAQTFLDINALHCFREGNGRTQRIFILNLAKYNGYELSFKNISSEEMIKLSNLSYDGEELGEKFLKTLKKIME